MAANTSPVFPSAPASYCGLLTVANTNRDGTTGTYVTIASGGDNGARVDRIVCTAQGVSHGGMVRLFVTSGESTVLVHEIPVNGQTPSATVRCFTAEWVRTDNNPVVLLGPSDILTASTNTAESAGLALCGFGGPY